MCFFTHFLAENTGEASKKAETEQSISAFFSDDSHAMNYFFMSKPMRMPS